MSAPGICFVVLAFALLLAKAVSAQESIVRGRKYYLRYCASCHGIR
jgi:mono/diheme cytochrome c family protein